MQNLGAPLAPILGQIQIKVQDFILEFNNQSNTYIDGLPLNCKIQKLSQPTKFKLKVMPPSWWQLTWGLLKNDKTIDCQNVYDCFIFSYERKPFPFEVKSILGMFKSSCVKKINIK